MGTKFRTLLAPIGLSTGDGRRFAEGAINTAATPFPFEWARKREGGHDGAVVVGAVQDVAVLSVADAIAQDWISADKVTGMNTATMGVWAKGELFDGVDREEMPRLAEDVAEAMHLMSEGTLGPSVDLDTFDGVPVLAGTDEPITFEQVEAHFEATGEEPKIELLITQGRVRAATLVSIPAFAETSRPLELVPGETSADLPALIASVSAPGREGVTVAMFDRPLLSGPTPITYDLETGRIFGHIATWRTCHAGFADVCITAPRDQSGGYSAFNRFPIETADGATIWAGRITAGGRHAELSLSASATMSAYDSKTTVAYVRAYEDEHGIVVAGVLEPGLSMESRQILSRRKVSGDWRETADGLSLIEVLALAPGPRAHSEPGFPVETFSRSGRQVALVASLGPDPEPSFVPLAPLVDVDALAAALEARQQERAARLASRDVLASVLADDRKTQVDALRSLMTSGA